jgi:hypothetical protein
MLLALLLMQAVAGPPGDEPVPVVQACPRDRDEAIVVCARAGSDRLRRLDAPVRGAPMTARLSPNAAVNAGATGFVRAGIPDNRILGHLKLAF